MVLRWFLPKMHRLQNNWNIIEYIVHGSKNGLLYDLTYLEL